jgi:DDE superfamily endonuclease
LLVIDGHESHNSLEFNEYYTENNIITLYMPSHSSHLLQPLNIGCFAPLKAVYGREVEDLIRNYINHVTNLEFLPAFKVVFNMTFIEENITAGFRGAGLVLYNLEAVISKLNIRLKTPTPPPEEELP